MSLSQSGFSFKLNQSPNIRWYILATASIGTFMSTLDSSIVNIALPTISEHLHSGLAILQWVVTAYLLAISSLLPVFGRIADMFGRKKVFSLGFIIFTLGSALCGAANSIWLLISMRVLQAVGASMLMANSAAIITAAFSHKERGRALGLIGTVVALGSLAGPAIGGILVGLIHWRAIFYVNIPIGLLGYVASQFILPPDQPKEDRETFDFAGAGLFTFGMICLLLAISNGHDLGWNSFVVLFGLIAGTLLLALFFIVETRVQQAMIDLSLFKIQPFLTGNLSGLLFFVAIFANVMLMPFYLQNILQYDPTQVGLMMTTFPLTMAIVAPISGAISDKIGFRLLTTGGLLITALGLLYLSTVTDQTTAWLVIPGPLLMGFGSGMFQSPNNSAVMGSVPPPKLGVAGGINALVRNMGMVIGIAFSVSLFENQQTIILRGLVNPTVAERTAAFLRSYHSVMLTGAVIAILGAVISFSRRSNTTGHSAHEPS